MIWQFITKKKCQRQLQLITLMHEENYSVTELADHILVSGKTILRDLAELQQKQYVIKKKCWQIDWQHEPSYKELYRKILMEDSRFHLFQQYLWGRGPKDINYSKLKVLNQSLICLNLSANLRTGSLAGEPALILHLQTRYLRDFCSFNNAELYRKMAHYYQDSTLISLNYDFFPNSTMVDRFKKKFGLQNHLIECFFLDYVRYHFQTCSDFYLNHKRNQTNLSREVDKGMALVNQMVIWEEGFMKRTFATKLFNLFLGIHQGLPLAVFNLQWKNEAAGDHFYTVSKKMKRAIPILSNCRLDELALALKNILFASHQVTLSLNTNNQSLSQIRESYESFIVSYEGK